MDGVDPVLDEADRRLQEIGRLASSMLEDGMSALASRDPVHAAAVRTQAVALAALDEATESFLLDALAAGPSGERARQLALRAKALGSLNRIGRYGYDVARAAADAPPGGDGVRVLRPVATAVQGMLGLVLQALQARVSPPLEDVLALEDLVDMAQAEAFAAVHAGLADPAARSAVQRLLVARSLERCADNVCKVAEKLHQAATGERVVLK